MPRTSARSTAPRLTKCARRSARRRGSARVLTTTRAPWWPACWATSARPSPEPGVSARRCARTARRCARAHHPERRGRRRRRSRTGPVGARSVTRTRAPPWRTALVTRFSTTIRSPGSQPVDDHRRLGQLDGDDDPPMARGRRRRRPRRRARSRSTVSCSSGPASPRASACSPSSRSTSRRCWASASSSIAVAARRVHVGMAPQRRQRRLHAGQRRAQLVAGVGGEAPRRGQRALAVGRAAAQPREHRVERARHRAQLRRPAVVGHAAVEVLVVGDRRGHRPQPPQRPQHDRRDQPHRDPDERPARRAPISATRRSQLVDAILQRRAGSRRPPAARAPPRSGSLSVVT